ncbi:unnamed protein product [Leptidea sinapis]|uniref:DDE-1 domain-containing protein n=1 Tax=Leptidea sinapis TaxID=189913 RepID=A0A5E4QAT4_9NEOP|nr:unnamed protein product [Leptidea sinapis]
MEARYFGLTRMDVRKMAYQLALKNHIKNQFRNEVAGSLTDAERGSLGTVVCCMSASGIFVQPMMIFPRKNFTDLLMKRAPPGAIHQAGFNLICLLNELTRENHVTIISLTPHTTHKLQPLDKTFMGALKSHYSEEIRKFLIHSEKIVKTYDIADPFAGHIKSQVFTEVDFIAEASNSDQSSRCLDNQRLTD